MLLISKETTLETQLEIPFMDLLPANEEGSFFAYFLLFFFYFLLVEYTRSK